MHARHKQVQASQGHATVLTRMAVVSLLALMFSGCATFQVAEKEAVFYVVAADADVAPCDASDFMEVALACHRIAEGNSTVVAVRQHSVSGREDERYMKVTFVFPATLREGDVVDLPEEGVKAFYSTGLSLRPGLTGCYGNAVSGKIEVTKMSEDRMELNASARFDLISPAGWEGHCTTYDFQSELKAVRRPLAELNAWEGVPAPGDSIITEGFPAR